MSSLSELTGLFVSALLSATLLPGSSEVLLVALLAGGGDPWLLGAVATVGNTLGSCITYAMGRGLTAAASRSRASWLPNEVKQQRAERLFQRYGLPSLLLAWLPVIGDAIALAAGVLRVPLALFIPLVALGKAARYAVLILIAS